MPTRPDPTPLAPAPTPTRRRIGLTVWKEARLKEKLRPKTPSEPWLEEQFKSALDVTPTGVAYLYRYHDPDVFPPGGTVHTAMRRCPTCNVFTPPTAFEDGQCLDHANHDAWGPSPSALAIQKLQIFHGRDIFTELLPDDWLSLQREIERFERRKQKKRNRVSED